MGHINVREMGTVYTGASRWAHQGAGVSHIHHRQCSSGSIFECRAAIFCSFRALLRKCQVTESESTFLKSGLSFFDCGMILKVRRSKTIQFKEWVLKIPAARCCNTKLCAVYWTKRHFAQMQAAPCEIAFRVPDETGSVPLSYQETLKLFANIAGLGSREAAHIWRGW